MKVLMVYMGGPQRDDHHCLSKMVELPGVPNKGHRFSVESKRGKAVFEVDEVEWRQDFHPVCYVFGVGWSSTSFGSIMLSENGWSYAPIKFFSQGDSTLDSVKTDSDTTDSSVKLRSDITSLVSLFRDTGLRPTKEDYLTFGRYTAVWHVDNDSERWVRLETLLKTPGYLVSYLDTFLGLKHEMFFCNTPAIAIQWIEAKLAMLKMHRSPYYTP